MAAPTTMSRPKAPQASGASSAQTSVSSVIPFIRGSGWGRYVFFDKSGLTLTTNTQDLGPIPVKAYDFMRSLVIEVTTTTPGGGSAVTTTEDGPYDVFTQVKVDQPNGQTMYQVSSGFSAAMIHAHGYYRNYNDPRQWESFSYTTGSGTAPALGFRMRVPFELNLSDSLGDLPNKDANAPFNLYLTLNTLANVFGGAPTSPTLRVRVWLEAADQPPETLGGSRVQTTPPAMNTLQRWTEQPIQYSAGQFDIRVRKLGNYVRLLVPIFRRSASTRANGELDIGDPVQVVLDEDVKDNIAFDAWVHDIYERYGYGQAGSTRDLFTGGLAGRWNGVRVVDYLSGPPGYDNMDRLLPTIESEDYILRSSWGNAGTATVLVGEVLPQGDIFA
jgi:hypothetical protein